MKPHNTIREGDNVLLYLDNKRKYLVKIEKGKILHTHKGFIKLEDLIGCVFGSKIESSLGFPFYALNPTVRDYISKISRPTQIIYPKDMGLILILSGVGPGSRVVEAGTGSGALTGFLAFHVRPDGCVYSYEIREEFIEKAKRNLERMMLLDYVEIKNADITKGIDEKNVDAVILDMASPWLVVPHAYEALKGGGSFVSFSPTIEQVIKTVETLKEHNFVYIETFECLIRRIRVERGKTRPETRMIGHTGYITSARKVME